MPTFDFTCERCGRSDRQYRDDGPPRFCSRKCQKEGVSYRRESAKWVVTPEAVDAIRKVYVTATGNGEVREVAKLVCLPRWKITRYAQSQGWIARTNKEPDWTERELEILWRSAHRSPEVIRKALRRAGYKRSMTGIVLKRKRMHYLKHLEGQSARSLAECFGVEQHCITRWIARGQLKADVRGLHRTPQQGGDHYYIKDKWVRDFVIENVAEIDIRKVDKYWFVDLLAGGKYGTGVREEAEMEDAEGEEAQG
jgi:hypothetical protein